MPREMREEQVTVYVRDDGQIDVSKFGDSDVLRPLGAHIDELRRENSARRREKEDLDSRLKEVQSDLDAAEGRAQTLSKELEDSKAKTEAEAEQLGTKERALKAAEQERDQLQKDLEGYRALGSVEELSERVQDADYGREQRMNDRISKAAKDAGLKPDAVLALGGVRDLNIEYRTIREKDEKTGETRKVEVPFVVRGEGKDDAVPLREDILTRFAALESSLVEQPGQSPRGGAPNTAPRPAAPAHFHQRPDPVTVPTTAAPDAILPDAFGVTGLSDALREDYGG